MFFLHEQLLSQVLHLVEQQLVLVLGLNLLHALLPEVLVEPLYLVLAVAELIDERFNFLWIIVFIHHSAQSLGLHVLNLLQRAHLLLHFFDLPLLRQ